MIKGQAHGDFLAAHLVPKNLKMHEDIPDEVIEANMISDDEVWQMSFDVALRMDLKGKIVAGVGVVFFSPHNYDLLHAFSLMEPYSNNVVEYNALLIGLQLAQWMGVKYFEAYGDFKLKVNQIKREYKVGHEDLISYHHVVIKLANIFDSFYISHVSRLQNTRVDTLATLSATLTLSTDTSYRLTVATRHLCWPRGPSL